MCGFSSMERKHKQNCKNRLIRLDMAIFFIFHSKKKRKKKLTIYNEIFLFPDRKSSSRYFLFNTYTGRWRAQVLSARRFPLFFFFFLWIFNSLPAKRDNLRLFSVIDVRAWAARRVLKQNRNMFFLKTKIWKCFIIYWSRR